MITRWAAVAMVVGCSAHEPVVGLPQVTPVVPCTGELGFPGRPLLPLRTGPIAAQDLDGDGFNDLVVADVDGSLHVALGHGDGTFADIQTDDVSVGDFEGFDDLALRDIDGDGVPDIVAALFSQDPEVENAVAVMRGRGDGTFADAVLLLPDSYGTAIALGDLDGDHVLDIVVVGYDVNARTPTLSIMRGGGDGSFAPPTSYPMPVLLPGPIGPDSGNSVAVGDLDGDGKPEVVVGSRGGGLALFHNDGTGAFETPSVFAPSLVVHGVAIADVTGDGTPDVVALTAVGNQAMTAVSVFPSNAGSLGIQRDVPTGVIYGLHLVLADLDGDGALDALIDGASLFGDGAGGFGPPVAIAAGGGWGLATADIDGDGLPEVISTDYDYTAVVHNLGNRAFLTSTSVPLPSPASAIQLVDLDGDGALDVVVATAAGRFVLAGDGTRGVSSTAVATDAAPVEGLRMFDGDEIELSDLDGDGVPDQIYFFAGEDSPGLGVVLGRYGTGGAYYTDADIDAFAVGDLDADGRPDIVVVDKSDGNSQLEILRGTCLP